MDDRQRLTVHAHDDHGRAVVVESRPDHEITVPLMFRALTTERHLLPRLAEIGPDRSQPDGWNCDGLLMVKYVLDEDRAVSRVLGVESKRILIKLHPGTPFFAQAMAHFAEHEADNVTDEWSRLRARGEAA